jgi:type III secretory pathway component EscS
MSKLENTIVGILLGGGCAWLSFVACWWTAAMVHMYFGGVSINLVIAAALTGLLVGIVLDVLFLRRWIRGFYAARLWLLAIVYGALCVVAVASFMGLPVGTFALGLLAGAYAGRRQIHNPSRDIPRHGLRRVALFAALLTAGAALPIGLLALQEPSARELFRTMLGIRPWGAGVVVISLLCMALFGAQYWCSLGAAGLALRIGAKRV